MLCPNRNPLSVCDSQRSLIALRVSGGKETQHDVWKYNASLNKWIQVEYLSTGRWRHKMTVSGGKVYAMGGFDGVQRLSSVEAYDPFHNSWTEVI